MAKVKIQGHASGTGVLTVTAPNTSTDRTITLPDATATIATTTDVAARLPSIVDGGNATAITIDSNEGVGIKNTNSDSFLYKGLVVGDGGASDQGINIYSAAWGALTFADATSGDGRYEGSIAYNHATNSMALATNHTTAMTIDSNGYVTMPAQPIASFGWTTHPVPTTTIIDASTIIVNIGSHLTSAGRFTAPVAGTYEYGFSGMMNNDTARMRVDLLKNGAVASDSIKAYTNSVQYSRASISGYITLAANDYLEFKNMMAILHRDYGQIHFKLVA